MSHFMMDNGIRFQKLPLLKYGPCPSCTVFRNPFCAFLIIALIAEDSMTLTFYNLVIAVEATNH